MSVPILHFGLAANRLHHETPDAVLFDWLRACSASIREMGVHLYTVGRTHDAISREGMLQGYARADPLPVWTRGRPDEAGRPGDGRTRRYGAVRRCDLFHRSCRLPSSVFPEAQALKRQCVTHGKPFISTLAGAREWMEVERLHAGLSPDPGAAELVRFFGADAGAGRA